MPEAAWRCRVCGGLFRSKQGAERCESRKTKKLLRRSRDSDECWELNDYVLFFSSGPIIEGPPRFGVIVDSYDEDHFTHPIVRFMDNQEEVRIRDFAGATLVLSEMDKESMVKLSQLILNDKTNTKE